MNGIKNLKIIALDSNVFIYNLEQNPDYVQFTDFIFNRLITNKSRAVTSIISLTEILSYPETEAVEKQIVEDFLSTPNLQVSNVDERIARKAAEIRREYKFRLPDAVQLATALINQAQVFITNDNRLKNFPELKVICLENIKQPVFEQN